jgi:predicted type IV restriction endonuclease
MSAEYELCRSNLEVLVASDIATPSHRNEATTRLQLIDRLFFDCLGWSKEDVVLEEPEGREYADYTFYLGFARRRVLIVEAKKEGDYFEVPVGKQQLEYSIPGLFRDSPNLKGAMEQAAQYCQSRGVPFAAISNVLKVN